MIRNADGCAGGRPGDEWIEYRVTLDVYGKHAKDRWGVDYTTLDGSFLWGNSIASRPIAGGMQYTLTSARTIYGPEYSPVRAIGEYVSDADTMYEGQHYDLRYEDGGIVLSDKYCGKY